MKHEKAINCPENSTKYKMVTEQPPCHEINCFRVNACRIECENPADLGEETHFNKRGMRASKQLPMITVALPQNLGTLFNTG